MAGVVAMPLPGAPGGAPLAVTGVVGVRTVAASGAAVSVWGPGDRSAAE